VRHCVLTAFGQTGNNDCELTLDWCLKIGEQSLAHRAKEGLEIGNGPTPGPQSAGANPDGLGMIKTLQRPGVKSYPNSCSPKSWKRVSSIQRGSPHLPDPA